MKVIDCPRCGGDVDKSTNSYEYGGSAIWECNDCDWWYRSGHGIGVGTDDDGTHPRRAGPGPDQSTINPVGEYCSECDIVVAGDHDCSVMSVLGEEMKELQDVIDELSEYHGNYGTTDVIEDAISNREIVLTPTFYYVKLFDEETFEQQLDLVEHEIILQSERNDGSRSFFRDGEVSIDKIYKRMDADNDIEKAFINECIKELHRRGRVRKDLGKVKPSDKVE